MSRSLGIANLFGRRSKQPPVARKRRSQPTQRFTAPESLERRAMLAFSPLPGSGDQLGAPIFISTDTAHQLHEMTVVLDDVSTPGFVTATITTKVDGSPDQTTQVFNFSDILFTAANDRAGSIVNRVSLWTSYEANLLGREMAPSDEASVGLSTNWIVGSQFGGALGTVALDLFNADSLTVTSGVLGGTNSTIRGEFESPTLPENIDPSNPDTYANVTLRSGTGISTATPADPIVASALTLEAQTGGVQLTQDVFTQFDLTLVAAQDISLSGLVEAIEGDVSLFSTSGDIAVLGRIHSIEGGVTITGVTGPVTLEDIFTAKDLRVAAAENIAIRGLLESSGGDIALTTTSGNIAIATDSDDPAAKAAIHAVSGSVTLSATRGAASIANVFAKGDITLDALGDVALNEVLHSVEGDVSLKANGLMNNDARIVAGNDITLDAGSRITALGGTIVSLELLSGGSNYEYAIVNIAPPASGAGRAALARAIIEFGPPAFDGSRRGPIIGLELVDPGYGYAPGEQVAVTFIGQPERTIRRTIGIDDDGAPIVESITLPAAAGATGVATASLSISSLTAGSDVKVEAGHSIELTTEIITRTGDVAMDARGGYLKVADLFSAGKVTLTAMETVGLAGLLHATAGDVTVESRGGGIDVSSIIIAPGGGVSLHSAGEVVQRGGSVSPNRLYLLSGGRDYTYALVVVAPPPGAGEEALARAIITPFDPFDVDAGGYISSIVLLDPGWGYRSDTRVTVSIQGDGEGAAAVFATDLLASVIDARDDIEINANSSITLVSQLRSSSGDVSVVATLGDIAIESITAAGTITVDAQQGTVDLVALTGNAGATIKAHQGLLITKSVNTVDGDILVETTNGDLAFVQQGFIDSYGLSDNALVDRDFLSLDPQTVLATKTGGDVSLRSLNGAIVTPYVINAFGNVSISGLTTVALANEITSQTGDITALSTSGRIRVTGNLVAEQGSISLDAQTAIAQLTQSGVTKIELLASGPVLSAPPDVTVTIDPPREGGEAAIAAALIERRALRRSYNDDDGGNDEDNIEYEYFIGSIAMLYPGRGYAIDEQPIVRITGVSGAVARAYGPTSVQMIAAQEDISLQAGENLELVTKVHSVAGDITIGSKTGDLDLSVDSLFVSAAAGAINIAADGGSARINRLTANRAIDVTTLQRLAIEGTAYSETGTISLRSLNDEVHAEQIHAAGDISIRGFRSMNLVGEIVSRDAGVNVSSDTGGVFLNTTLQTKTDVTLTVDTFVEQSDGTGVERIDVVAPGRQLNTFPEVTATISPPVGGGLTASARVIIGQRSLGRNAVTDDETVEYFVERIDITNPGSGYALGETPSVVLNGIIGAVAVATGPTNMRTITAGNDVTINAGNTLRLVTDVTALQGSIMLTSRTGNIATAAADQVLHAPNGVIDIEAPAGSVTTQQLTSSGVTLSANLDITTFGTITTTESLKIESLSGSVQTFDLIAGDDVTATALGNVALGGLIESLGGSIVVTTTAGDVTLSANIVAHNGTISLKSQSGIAQSLTTGLRDIQVLSGGSLVRSGINAQAPDASVSIAPPENGGIAATAQAVIGRRDAGDFFGEPLFEYFVESIIITSPGVGYSAGESPLITIVGIQGASAQAIGQTGARDLWAGADVFLDAGSDVVLLTTVTALSGDVSIYSHSGNVRLDHTGQLIHAGRHVSLSATAGAISAQQVTAGTAGDVDGNITATALRNLEIFDIATALDGGIVLTSHAGAVDVRNLRSRDDITVTATVGGNVRDVVHTTQGNIELESTAGGFLLDANLVATKGKLIVRAQSTITQLATSGLVTIEILAEGSVIRTGSNQTAPEVTVVIDPPANGGVSAVAEATVGQRQLGLDGFGRPIFEYFVAGVTLVDSGSGYAAGEEPRVRVSGLSGARARAITQTSPRQLTAGSDIELLAGNTITLSTILRSDAGDVTLETRDGDLLFTEQPNQLVHAVTGSVALRSQAGQALLQTVTAGKDVTVTTLRDVLVSDLLHAGGDATIESRAGGSDLQNLLAGGKISVSVYDSLSVGGLTTAQNGDLLLSSVAGSISVDSRLRAIGGSISLDAGVNISEVVQTGIAGILLTSPGLEFQFGEQPNPPVVLVTIAPPERGGTAARAIARVGSRYFDEGAAGPSGADFYQYFIESIELIDPGSGYSIGERPEVIIFGLDGASAVAIARSEVDAAAFIADNDVSIRASRDITLVGAVRSNTGMVSIASIDGDLDLSEPGQLVHAVEGSVTLESKAGGTTVQQLTAGAGVNVTALHDVRLLGAVDSMTGAVNVTSTSGALSVRDQVHAQGGSIALVAKAGQATVQNLVAEDTVTVTGLSLVTVAGDVTANTGNVTVTSTSGVINLGANIHARDESILVTAHGELRQALPGGLVGLEVLLAGSVQSDAAPEVTVTIAAAVGGGTAATAVATLGSVDDGASSIWFIESITLTNPGTGYAIGEVPLVTIEGMPGAFARAIAPVGLQNLVAGKNLTILAGDNVTLTSVARAFTGNVEIRSIDGDLDLSEPGQLVHAVAGSVVLDTLAGSIEYQQLIAAQDITLRSFRTLTVNNQLTTTGGDVTLAARGADVVLAANVLAADTIDISAKTGITQNDGLLKATNLRATNITATPIALGNAENDVDRFAATNVGDVTFTDANDFRVGLQTSGVMGVELTGATVNLSAPGMIKVVAGIEARSLSIAADTVEFVTTNATDNAAPNAPFAGTLRDMIRISNDNTNLVSDHMMVFDEPGYAAMSEVAVQAALPQFTRAVTIEGGRVHDSVATGRLGIRGQANVATGLSFGQGSAGSTLRGAAVYGFSGGSAIVVESPRNTIENMYVGIRADGTSVSANRVGVNLTGTRANSNTIGSFVFDDTTANRFAGNTDAAIVVQRGASSNLIAGNHVGVSGLAANRTGIRIDGGAGNRIGTADQVTADGTPTPSNQIRGNTHYGIEIRNTRGGNTVVENNVVAGNATKAGNGAHGIGVLNSMNVVIGGASELARNQVFSQIGGSGIHLSGSSKVSIIGNHIGTEGYHLTADSANPPSLGNGRHGIDVFGRSRDVQITANRIVDNGGSGVAIASGSSGVVLSRNEIGVFTHPVTGNVHGAGNKADGVTITAANGNVVGAGNVIGFNAGSGVRVENSVAAGLPTGNRVVGSEIFGNTGHGVHVVGSSRQTVGGMGADDGNIVKENNLDGVRIEADPRIRASAGPHGNLVTGNFLGTNDNEEIDRSWGNRFGVSVVNGTNNTIADNIVMNNRSGGVEIAGGSGNTVGGTTAGAGNFIGYNLYNGVFIHDQASTQRNVGVVHTTIENGGAGYNASRTSVIFTNPKAEGGVPARGVAIISAEGRVTGIRITASGTGYESGEAVSVTIFDPQATTPATANVTLGTIQGVSSVSRQHTVSGNLIEGNNGAGVYVKGDRVTEVTIGQSLSGSTPIGAGNTIAYHNVGVMVDAAKRVGVLGNRYQDNGSPIEMMNGGNIPVGLAALDLVNLASFVSGRSQTTVSGQLVNAGPLHQYWVDVYSTPHWDMEYFEDGRADGHQMRQFLGRALVTTDANGQATLNLAISQAVEVGDYVSVKITSARYEAGTTVGVFHSQVRHSLTAVPTPSPRTPAPTPTEPSPPSTTNPPPTRGPVPPSRT